MESGINQEENQEDRKRRYHVTQLNISQPFKPYKIHIQILQTDLHTILLRIVERIWFKIKAFSSCMMICWCC